MHPIHEHIRQLGRRFRDINPWYLVLAFAAPFLIALAVSVIVHAGPPIAAVAVLGAVAVFVRTWLREFALLMSLEDADLPGRHDKAIWAALLLVAPPAGVYLFRGYRFARWPEPEAKPEPIRDLA